MTATNRTWVIGAAATTALLVAGGLLLGVQPQLARADTANAQTAAVDAQVGAAQARVAGLSKVAARQGALEAQQTVLAKAIPSALQANTFYRRVSAVAALAEVRVSSVAQSAGTPYTVPVAAAATGSTPSATPAPGASQPAPLLVATDPTITGTNLTIVPTVVTVVGTAEAGLRFADEIQGDERLFLVSAVSQQPNGDDASKTVTTLSGSVYVLKY